MFLGRVLNRVPEESKVGNRLTGSGLHCACARAASLHKPGCCACGCITPLLPCECEPLRAGMFSCLCCCMHTRGGVVCMSVICTCVCTSCDFFFLAWVLAWVHGCVSLHSYWDSRCARVTCKLPEWHRSREPGQSRTPLEVPLTPSTNGAIT